MAKFNQRDTTTRAGRAPIANDTRPSGWTFEGAPGYARDAKSELFTLAVANMVSEDTFYESGPNRDDRYERLIHQVAVEDPEWTRQFLAWLRDGANMRSASLVGGLEAARALLAAQIPLGRTLVSSVLQRPDEPGEALAYWLSRYGRKVPSPVKRGIADGVIRLYNEYSLLKYDTSSHAVRFGDVIELTHPGDRKANQQGLVTPQLGDLFKHALDRRHNRDNPAPESLEMVRWNSALRAQAAEDPARLLDPERLKAAGMTWEDVLSLVGSKVPKKDLWEALIPSMGYMALLRNLRNFDEAGISETARLAVSTRLMDPTQVARSRQFPFRFLSAYRSLGSLNWGPTLEVALTESLANVPALSGRTLVLVDRSGSMFSSYGRGSVTRADQAAVFGTSLALRNAGQVDLVEYGSSSAVVQHQTGDSVLKVATDRFHGMGGTHTKAAAQAHFRGHDRVVLVTDEQSYDGDPADVIPAKVPVYTWNLGGYALSHGGAAPNRHYFAGLTDAAFKMIPLLEAGRDAGWPWEQ